MKNILRAIALLPVIILASCGSTAPAEAQPKTPTYASEPAANQQFVAVAALQGAFEFASELNQAKLLTGQDIKDLDLIFNAAKASILAGDYDLALADLTEAFPILNAAAQRSEPAKAA